MPWRGWNEDQVRGSVQISSQPTQRYVPMPGFTPINAPISRSTAPSPGQLEGSRGTSDQRQTRTVASNYLGREGDLPAAPPPKQSDTQGKRRAVTAGDAAKTNKRRRSSDVDDGLRVTKSRGNYDEQISKPSEDDKPAKSSKPNKKATASKQPKKTSGTVGAGNDEAEASTTRSVSVYAPVTSMDVLDSTSARTSLDSMKANAGQSFTLYQGPSSTSSFQSSFRFFQPLLNSSSQPTHIQPQTTVEATKKAQHDDGFAYPTSDNDEISARDAPVSRRPNQAHSPRTTDDVAEKLKVPGDASRLTSRPKKAVNCRAEQDFSDIDAMQNVRPEPPKPAATKLRRSQSTVTLVDEDDFGELAEEDMAELADEVEKVVAERNSLTPPPRDRKQNMREVDEHEDYGGMLLSDAERQLLVKMKNASEGKVKPIVRKPFQPAILDRSPIFGASKSSLLRTSFRVGEALNVGAQAVRCNENVIIELYARATVSKREGRKQHFVFKDLYHDKPPYMEGTYELWDQAFLWDLDSKPFLKAKGPGILSRVIGRMKREDQKWRLEILNVWEASWEDVNFVEAIYTGGVYDEDEEDEYNI